MIAGEEGGGYLNCGSAQRCNQIHEMIVNLIDKTLISRTRLQPVSAGAETR